MMVLNEQICKVKQLQKKGHYGNKNDFPEETLRRRLLIF